MKLASQGEGYFEHSHNTLSLRPTSKQLAQFKLKNGKNSITFLAKCKILGEQRIDARIYLLN